MKINFEKVNASLTDWNTLRLEQVGVKEAIKTLETRVECLSEEMHDIQRGIETELFFIEQPYGVKIDGDHIIVIHDDQRDEFTIQVIDFPQEVS